MTMEVMFKMTSEIEREAREILEGSIPLGDGQRGRRMYIPRCTHCSGVVQHGECVECGRESEDDDY